MCCNCIPRRLMLALAAAGLLIGLGTFVSNYAFADEAKKTPKAQAKAEVPAVLDFKVKTIKGEEVHLGKYHGDVVLIVNTASKCGLTPQYEQLQTLHEDYAEQGLSIIGFPANNFGKQEPGTDKEIGEFCRINYGVEFDMFAKVSVKGDDQAPLYAFLTSKETNPGFAGDIRWNFDKFLVNREGKVVARFAPKTKPGSEEVIKAIKAELAKAAPKAANKASETE